jgi:hypothetical protein
MSIYQLGIIKGPPKAALLAAMANDREHKHVAFETDEGSFEAHIDGCDDLGGNALGVAIRGHIVSGCYQGRSFIGTYDPDTDKGSLNISFAADPPT